MGLATSQVRLLALTSRKADVEMKIQLNSKRKTMLTRESSELAKLYYAKLQNSRIQYSTGDGYQDVTYDYLMGQDSFSYFNEILTKGTYSKPAANMVLTDNYGRVILSDDMLDIVLTTLNNNLDPANQSKTVQDLTYEAVWQLIENMYSKVPNEQEIQDDLYVVKQWVDYFKKDENRDILEYFCNNGIYRTTAISIKPTDNTCTSFVNPSDNTPVTLVKGSFYYVQQSRGPITDGRYLYFPTHSGATNGLVKNTMQFSYPGSPSSSTNLFYDTGLTRLKELCNVLNYYGYIFSAAFNGKQAIQHDDGTNVEMGTNFNVAIASGDVVYDSNLHQFVRKSNSKYDAATNTDNLQEGLKSGIYQLLEVSSKTNGTYTKAHGLDYFQTLNYVTERTDSDARETITAWYNAAKADLSEKEDYWDTEITALSSELNAITTEIDSVKSLRQNAIESTFKWGAA